MSYRPAEQALSDPLSDLLNIISRESLHDLTNAIHEREDSGEWNSIHIDELNDLLIDLRKLRIKVKKLKSDNW